MSALPTVFPLTIPAKRLTESITPSATSFQISDVLKWDGTDLTSADLGEVAYGAFRDTNGTMLELFSYDPTTIASTGITFVHRGLPFNGDRVTEVAANKLTWVRGTTIVELGSDFPQLYQYLIDYINNIALQGAPDASTTVKGVSKLSAAPLSPSNPIVVGDTDPRIMPNAYGEDAGSNDTYVITLTTAPAAYAKGQEYVFKANTANAGPATLNINSLGAKTILRSTGNALVDNDIQAGQIVAVVYDGTNFRLTARISAKFGGNGADGALTVSSGTTSIDLGGAAVVVKNYTSISITGTGAVAFTNPNAAGTIVILKSQGNVTITSSATPAIDLRAIGAAGGAAGTDGTSPTGLLINTNVPAGKAGVTSTPGVAGPIYDFANFYFKDALFLFRKAINLVCGAGGGGGTTNSSSIGGAGGRGGGALLIQCGGSLNFTGVINSSGSVGSVSSAPTGTDRSGSAGGGGSAGMVAILYNALTANSGTITATGGVGGAGTTGVGTTGGTLGGASGAGSIFAAGGIGGANTANGGAAGGLGSGGGGAGNNTTTATNVGGTAGGSMSGVITANTEFE